MSSVSAPFGLSPFECLPTELIVMVSAYLSNRDLKTLRLISRAVIQKVSLRFNRVFFSANPRNVEVFCAIAEHVIFRHQVREVIWDDTQLPDNVPLTTSQEYEVQDMLDLWEKYFSCSPKGAPEWFIHGCYRSHRDSYVTSLDRKADLSLKDSWNYYLQLLYQQDDVLTFGADVKAFSHRLSRFSNLKRITLTGAAHGFLNNPLYETPMIRSFPRGFNYPVPGAWSAETDENGIPVGVPTWEQNVSGVKWRGFWVIVNELAERGHGINEFIIETNDLRLGLNCRIFEKPFGEDQYLVRLLQQPELKRFDLALLADGQYYWHQRQHWTAYLQQDQPWSAFRSGLLKQALEKLVDPNHVSIRIQMDEYLCFEYLDAHDSRGLPLHSIVPVGKWHNIRHLGLSGLIVEVDELFTVLAAQPAILRSVELSDLIFTGDKR